MELTPTQLKIVNHHYNPKSVLSIQAGPGTGKTFALVKRIQKLIADGVSPQSIVVLSLTNRTVNSLRSALAEYIGSQPGDVVIKTFHSFAHDLIESNLQEYFPEKGRQMLLDDISFQNYRALFMSGKGVKQLHLEKAMSEVRDGKDIADVAEKYEIVQSDLCDTIKFFNDNGMIRYSDFIRNAIGLLDISKGEIVKDIQVLMVDEFQDMQPQLVTFIEKLVEFGDKHITLAGDSNQCIYEFLGSSPDITENFISKLGWETEEICLNESFRLSPQNLDISNVVIDQNKLVSMKEPSAGPTVYSLVSKYDEYNYIGSEIARLICQSGGLLKFSDFMILASQNREVDSISKFMTDHFGYNVNKYSSNSDWVNSNVHILIDILSVLNKGTGSDLALLCTLMKLGNSKSLVRDLYLSYRSTQSPGLEDYLKSESATCKFNTKPRFKFKERIDLFLNVIQQERKNLDDPVSIMASLARIIKETGIIAQLNKPARGHKDQENETKLLNNLSSFYESLSLSYKKTPSLDYFLNNYLEDEPVLEEHSINVSTVHKAKGLEFPVVFVTNFPGYYRSVNARLLYVALTRAKNLLYTGYQGNTFQAYSSSRGFEMNRAWISSTARDLQRNNPSKHLLNAGMRILKTSRLI
ncbi:ATP-dependent DNA helicase, mitochondrial precursor, putative [Candida dubliniensis CD36]|uniref:DNA 3'-5' helicase n=1 Tax=Candida dubliniensis (strain CD36 / ATCC MYA-646 / CBS 7987 / NCPF 3949 / NRRL Y-17841) TaxID=573826 RepID=B9WN68_CANDC|nr:ATP-dependent DNA helicase, mitochondrial precursor, putative [Candida dubliniensis CD36]CAX40535.1 ATP-dependent DNA helicase, mitochondrial precursor, putative [Candida dubliniensis CD36]